jgi:hypothetical protein
LVDLRDAGLRYDVHPGVLYYLGAVFPNLRGRIKPEEIAIGFVEMGHVAFGIRDQAPIVDAVINEPVDLQLMFQIPGLKMRSLFFIPLETVLLYHLTVHSASPCLKGRM